jgi:hypothetical protein
MNEDMNDEVEHYLRQLTDAQGPEARTAIYDKIQEEHPELLGDTFLAMIEYQAALIDHLLTTSMPDLAKELNDDLIARKRDGVVEFPREGKRLDLKDIEVDPNA